MTPDEIQNANALLKIRKIIIDHTSMHMNEMDFFLNLYEKVDESLTELSTLIGSRLIEEYNDQKFTKSQCI